MIVINALLESGRTDRAREYLNNMNSGISSTLTKISTGNFISDALINNKAVMAAEHGVSIKFSGQVIPFGIADEDLCTVLANILDNAIEATKKLTTNKNVRIDAALRNGFFLMNISNPVENEVKIRKDGTIKTSKKNQSEHGFGIKNVQKAVKKYGGTVSVTCENKVFSVDIMMKPVS
jgi:sensor histidine kinase regulating citrate/malate metabolism